MIRRPPARLHYGWIVVAVTCPLLLMTAGIRAAPGVMILPLEQQFGWDRTTVSLAVSINLLLYGLCGPWVASYIDRFGLRKVVLGALSLVVVGVGLTASIQQSWQLDLLWGGVVGLSTGATAIVMAAAVANRWFAKRRGMVMGLLTSANAAGTLVFLPILALIAVNIGWQFAVLILAGVALLLMPLVAVFMRDRPSDLGLEPYGAEPAASTAPVEPPLSAMAVLRLGVRSADFWLLGGSYFVCGASTLGLIGTHFIPASVEHGIPEVTAASLLASMGLFNIMGTTASGWLTDRIDGRWLLCGYYLARGISLLFLPYAFGLGTLGLLPFMIFYGLDWVATVPPTAALSGEIFGRRNGPVVFGWMSAMHQVGSAVAAFGAGVLRTWLGDYQLAFMSSGLLCLIAAGIVIRIRRSPPAIPLPSFAAAKERLGEGTPRLAPETA